MKIEWRNFRLNSLAGLALSALGLGAACWGLSLLAENRGEATANKVVVDSSLTADDGELELQPAVRTFLIDPQVVPCQGTEGFCQSCGKVSGAGRGCGWSCAQSSRSRRTPTSSRRATTYAIVYAAGRWTGSPLFSRGPARTGRSWCAA